MKERVYAMKEPPRFSGDQRRKIAELADDLSPAEPAADFSTSTLLTFRLSPSTPVAELANDFLIRTNAIEYEQKRQTLEVLGGYAVQFAQLSPDERQQYTNIIPGISRFAEHISEMRDRARVYSGDNEQKLTQVRQFLSYVIMDNVETAKDLPEDGLSAIL